MPLYKWLGDLETWDSDVVGNSENAFGDEGDGSVYTVASLATISFVIEGDELIPISTTENHELENLNDGKGGLPQVPTDGQF